MKRVILLICAVSSAAWATTLLALDLTGLTKSADAVVRGRVLSVAPRWNRDHSRIITDTEIEVSETWKGAASTKRVTVMQPGGEIDDIGQRVEGVATFKVGEEVVVFLEARGDRFTMAGMAQGRFIVEHTASAVTVRQDQANDLYLVSASSHQPTAPAPIAVELSALKKQVLVTAPAEPTSPISPVKVGP